MNDQPTELPLFLLKSVVLFPHTAVPLRVFEPRYKQLVSRCLAMPTPAFGVVLIKGGPEVESDSSVETVTAVPHRIGTLGRIVEVDQRDDDTIHLVVLGSARFQIEEVVQSGPYLVARVAYFDDRPGAKAEVLSDLAETARTLGKRHLRLLAAALSRDDDDGSHLLERVWKQAPTDPSAFSFFLGALIQTAHSDRQRLLRTETTADRLQDEVGVLRRENEILRASVRHRQHPSKPRLN
ncbi:MAG: hypothetical protein CL878_03160 [Dehalococcoidia bacterium]|nr:hypothetical protein [Dehalococcoidia bacterium]